MLKIVCVNAGNYLGQGAEYVAILHDMVSRNLPVGTKFEFICFTDNFSEITDLGVSTRLLHPGLRGWWNKLALFKEGTFALDDRIVFFDLDTVITGDLGDIIKYDGSFAILRDFYRPQGLGSGVMAWRGDWGAHIWREYEKAGYPDIAGGDQAWIEQHVLRPDILQELFPGQLVSYKVNAHSFIPQGARVVAFHGEPRPHHCDGWVEQFWKVGGSNTLDAVGGNTEESQLALNTDYSSKIDRQWVQQVAEHDGHAVIIGGGPSLRKDLEEIRKRKDAGQHVFALNNSWKWLLDNEILADAHVMLDARRENAKFVPTPSAITKYYASQCAKEVWDAAPDALLWNHLNAQNIIGDDPRANTLIAGGSTVGLNAMALVYVLGYRKIHLYGFDSSYDDERHHHAYEQALNDKERVVTVTAAGEEFITAAWMAQQVSEFCLLLPQLMELGCTVTVHGYGLLQHVAKNDIKSLPFSTAEDERASAILDKISSMKNPVGVEVGVFSGSLSKRLLQRQDLTLHMVDSWIEHGKNSEYAKSGDYHGNLSQLHQDNLYQRTATVTSFAGERAKIIRKDSMVAANDFADASLDFVFLDADHTYEAVKLDIAAWMPKIKNGGYLCGHDYDHPGFPSWGVKKAVDELALPIETGLNFTWFTQIQQGA